MTDTPLQRLHAAGQSIWLDYIDRPMLWNGELERRITEDLLTGMTSNPTIFEKAFAEGHDYDEQLSSMEPGKTPWEVFEAVATDDVRRACDLFRPTYDRTGGGDGFVSIEVSPGVADDAEGTIAEARRLWGVVDRPNVMIKVPGTDAGATAVRQLTEDGVNVNITLLFAVESHRRVIEAYLAGLEARVAAGKPVDHIASVASFFVSRVDTAVDKRLDAIVAEGGERADMAKALHGKAAIANAKMAYRLFCSMFSGARWDALAAKGARPQRPLWASTSTKNPAYRDVMYVEQLIGPHTVNTLPPATIEAFRDHGVVERTVDHDVEAATRTLAQLEALGISLSEITETLLVDGLASFQKSFDTLLARLETKLGAVRVGA
ncbi:MAG TPA: transaldolase [Gemmatimonadaceae bacterium]|nr:transaldolase [Gemmatimonadaceae bacterium]